MRVVQSFIPTTYQQNLELYLDLTEASVNSILKFYDEVVLYTTPSIAELVKKRNIGYTEINTELFKEVEHLPVNYAVPKLECYLAQKSPFIHIDYDVVLLSRITEEKDFTIGYYDFDLINNPFKIDELNMLDSYYVQDLREIHPLLPYDVQKVLDFRLLPNFSIFGVNNLVLCKVIFKEILKFYNEHKAVFEQLKHGPSMLEQFLFITYLRYFLNWEVKVEDVVGKMQQYLVDPEEYIAGAKQYAKFLHLQGTNKNTEFLEKLISYVNEK